jgi:hypothetical protein
MTAARSLTVDQRWSDMTHADVVAWINFHGDAVARARGKLVIVAEEYAKLIKTTRAHERHEFKVQDFIDALLNTSDAHLALEVSAWLDGQ